MANSNQLKTVKKLEENNKLGLDQDTEAIIGRKDRRL
jgi:hypothetical protein